MKILLINLEFDCSGVAWILRNAINKTKHEARVVIRQHTKITEGKDYDLIFNKLEELEPLIEWADVLHFNTWIWTHQPTEVLPDRYAFKPEKQSSFFDRWKGKKKFIFHFHGGKSQLNPDYWLKECKKATILKCDPIAPIKGALWLPNIIDLEGVEPKEREGIKVSVASSLSDERRINKMVESMLDYLNIEKDFVADLPKKEALERRNNYSVSIDNTTQGFIGMWGWESLALGQTLIARLSEGTRIAYKEFLGSNPPIISCENIDEIASEIRKLTPEKIRRNYHYNINWIKKHYKNIVNEYIKIYEK